MLKIERIKKIKEILLEYKHINIETLSSLLSVSEATVRRDIDKLEGEGFLKKFYGGALLNENNIYDMQINNATDAMENEKKQIGLISSKLVDNNDIIFLGAGSTCLQVAKNIKNKKNLTVITNSINIVLELANTNNINVILPGGDLEVLDTSLSMVGQYTLNNLSNIFINKTFFSVDGASIEFGYTVNKRHQVDLLSHLFCRSNQSILLCDYMKFDKRAFIPIGPLNLIKTVITNINIPDKYKEYYYDNGVKVFTTIEEFENC